MAAPRSPLSEVLRTDRRSMVAFALELALDWTRLLRTTLGGARRRARWSAARVGVDGDDSSNMVGGLILRDSDQGRDSRQSSGARWVRVRLSRKRTLSRWSQARRGVAGRQRRATTARTTNNARGAPYCRRRWRSGWTPAAEEESHRGVLRFRRKMCWR